jgi:hypothetical protein
MRMTLFALTFAAAGAAHAWEHTSLALTCVVANSTYMCPVAFTRASSVEAIAMSGGEMRVLGIFQGPGYHIENVGSSTLVWFLPSTWEARVLPTSVCAWSGAHSAEGQHTSNIHNGLFDQPMYPPEQTLSFHIQWSCDCGSSPP